MMKSLAIYILLTVLLAGSAAAQAKAGAAETQKFAEALERQISCGQKIEPYKAIRALQKSQVIAQSPYIVSDSLSFFKIKKPLSVFGFKVYSVLGYDEIPKFFARGPRTSPGISLGVVVLYSVEEVKEKLKNLNPQGTIVIDESIDETGAKGQPRIRTEIICSN